MKQIYKRQDEKNRSNGRIYTYKVTCPNWDWETRKPLPAMAEKLDMKAKQSKMSAEHYKGWPD